MKTVLIVDDNEANRYLLKSLLEGNGLKAVTAENGRVALSLALDDPPDLIVSDILMPDMDGYAFCRECKANERLAKIPFVFYTATYTEPKDERFALSLGADRFLIKPQKPEELLRLLMAFLTEESVRPTSRPKPLGDEMEFFRTHNEILFAKLEEKMADLEAANRKLAAFGEKYRLSFVHASDVILTIGPDLRVDSMSPSVERILGYSPREFVGLPVPELARIFAPESFVRAMADAARTLGGETISEAVYEFIARDGTSRFVEVSGSPVRGEGKIAGMIAVARDITERRKAEERLRENEKKYHDLFEFLPIPVYEMDLEANITAANQAVYKTFGGSEEVLKNGFNAWQLLSPDEVAKSRSNIQKLIKGEPIEATEYMFRRLDGSTFPALVISNVIYSGDRPERIRGAIIDITDRRRAEEDLRRMNMFLDSIVENIPNMIFLKDARDLRFIRFNRAGENLLGYSRDELLGKNDFDFFPKAQADEYTRQDREVLAGKATIDIPSEPVQTRDQGERTLHTKKVPLLNAAGDPDYLLGISEDITERIQVESALRKSEERLRRYFELPLIGMAITSPEKGWIEVNERLLSIIGYSREELRRLSWAALTHPDDLAADVAQFDRVIAGEIEGYSIDKRFIHKDGRTIWTAMAVGCVRRPDRSVDYFAVFLDDITVRKKSEERIGNTLKATIQAIAVTLETRDPYTAGHQRRVANLAQSIAEELRLPKDQIDGLRLAATIHDLGKISVPAEILSKPTKLSGAEFGLIKIHSQMGYDILKDIEFPWPIARMILEHHERMDGSGYPNGTKGEDLLLESRILMVADVVEAMASDRPYRPAVGLEAALSEIRNHKGSHYDPSVADACLRIFEEKGFVFD